MLHYSLRTLIAAVAFVAVACAALMNATSWIASTASTVTVFLLATTTVVAVLASSPRRGSWAGFAIAGWAYLLVALGPMDAGFKSTLWTTVLLQKAAAASPRAVLTLQQPVYTTYTIPSPLANVTMTPQVFGSPPPPLQATCHARRNVRRPRPGFAARIA